MGFSRYLWLVVPLPIPLPVSLLVSLLWLHSVRQVALVPQIHNGSFCITYSRTSENETNRDMARSTKDSGMHLKRTYTNPPNTTQQKLGQEQFSWDHGHTLSKSFSFFCPHLLFYSLAVTISACKIFYALSSCRGSKWAGHVLMQLFC